MVSTSTDRRTGGAPKSSPASSSRPALKKWTVDGILNKAKKLFGNWSWSQPFKALLPTAHGNGDINDGDGARLSVAKKSAKVKGNAKSKKEEVPPADNVKETLTAAAAHEETSDNTPTKLDSQPSNGATTTPIAPTSVLKRTPNANPSLPPFLSEVIQSKLKPAAQKKLKKLEAKNTKENGKAVVSTLLQANHIHKHQDPREDATDGMNQSLFSWMACMKGLAPLRPLQTPLQDINAPGCGSRKRKVKFGSNQVKAISPLSTVKEVLAGRDSASSSIEKENECGRETEEGESLNFELDAISTPPFKMIESTEDEDDDEEEEQSAKAQKVDIEKAGRSPLRGNRAKFAMFVVPTFSKEVSP